MVSNGSAVLRTIAVRCREVGARGNMNALRAGIRGTAGPLINEYRARARADLPHTGGLNLHVADGPIRVSTTTGLRSSQVRIKAGQTDTSQLDNGFVRKPVFNTGKWVRQSVPQAAGSWTDTMKSGSPAVTAAINVELLKLARYLEV